MIRKISGRKLSLVQSRSLTISGTGDGLTPLPKPGVCALRLPGCFRPPWIHRVGIGRRSIGWLLCGWGADLHPSSLKIHARSPEPHGKAIEIFGNSVMPKSEEERGGDTRRQQK